MHLYALLLLEHTVPGPVGLDRTRLDRRAEFIGIGASYASAYDNSRSRESQLGLPIGTVFPPSPIADDSSGIVFGPSKLIFFSISYHIPVFFYPFTISEQYSIGLEVCVME